MNRGFWMVLVALAACLAGFLATRSQWLAPQEEAPPHEDGVRTPELAWLRHEFDLNDEEFAKVSALHLAYLPTCESLCKRIATARSNVRGLVLAGSSVSPELEAALREEAALRADCQAAMLGHLYETAAVLPPAKARAYLDAMLPEILEMTMDPAAPHAGH